MTFFIFLYLVLVSVFLSIQCLFCCNIGLISFSKISYVENSRSSPLQLCVLKILLSDRMDFHIFEYIYIYIYIYILSAKEHHYLNRSSSLIEKHHIQV